MLASIRFKIWLALSCCALLSTLPLAQAGGNKALMEQAKQKTFLLNQEVIKSLDKVQENTAVTFIGSVSRDANGKLQITIDSVQDLPSSPAPAARPTVRNKQYIRYISFEEMIKENKNSRTPNYYGGGSAIKDY